MTHSVSTARSLLLLLAAVTLAGLTLLGAIPPDEGQLEAAIENQRARVAIEPTVAHLNDLANLLVLDGNLPEAEALYRSALDADPDNIEVLYNLALLTQHLGRDDEALELFRKVVDRAPTAAWAHLQIGVIASDRGRRREAVAAFGRAFTLEPRLSSPSVNPHVARRPEALEALISHTGVETDRGAPMSFAQPDRISRLLLRDSAAVRAATRSVTRRGLMEEDETAVADGLEGEAEKAARRLDLESLPEDSMAESSAAVALEDADSAASPSALSAGIDDEPEGEADPGAAPRRVVGPEDLRGATVGAAAPGSAPASGQSRSTAPSARPGTVRPDRAQPSGGVGIPGANDRRPSTGASRFRPGERSSARLDLELAAPAPERLTAVARSRWLPVEPGTTGGRR